MAPTTMKACKVGRRSYLQILWNGITRRDFSHGASITETTTPTIDDNQVLVRVTAVTTNPTDYKHIDFVSPPDAIIGCDFAGVVETVGSAAPGGWKSGDRIAGVVHGGVFPDRGSFAQYLKADGDLAWKIPSSMTDEDAATYGISATTAMQGLYLNLDMPWPNEQPRKDQPVLFVYSGATAASLFAIQMAKKAGYQVVVTCSPHSNDLVKRYGADSVFDYRDKDAVQQIRQKHPNITGAFDGFSEGTSTKFCVDVIGDKGGKVISLTIGGKSKRTEVKVVPILMYTLLGKPFALLQPIGPKYDAKPDDRAGLARFYGMLPGLVNDVLRPPPVKPIDGGFDGIFEALALLKAGKASGQKFAVKLS